MSHVELARIWKSRPGPMWWIIAKSGLRLAQKKMALSAGTEGAGV